MTGAVGASSSTAPPTAFGRSFCLAEFLRLVRLATRSNTWVFQSGAIYDPNYFEELNHRSDHPGCKLAAMSEYQYPNADIAELLALLNATEGVEEIKKS